MVQESVVYRYFLTDLLSNEIISEVPFRGVTFGRVNRRAGEFSGTIPFVEATKGLNLYEATMPGRSGLYVMRNDSCVWGGIIWSRSYDVESKELQVSGAEFMSYFYHRTVWQTVQYGSEFIGVSSYAVSSGTAIITTEFPHGFRIGDMVRIGFVSPTVDGTYRVTGVPTASQFTYETLAADSSGISLSGACRSLVDTYDFARDLVDLVSTDLAGLEFVNEAIKPAKEIQNSVISKEQSAGLVTIRTSQDHSIIPGQEIELIEVDPNLDGFHVVSEVPDPRTIRFEWFGPDIPRTDLAGIRSVNVVTKQLLDNLAILVLEAAHGASVGQTVIVEGVDSFFTGKLDTVFNGRFTVTSTPATNIITYVSGGILNVGPEAANGGVATFGSKVVYGDYGGYTANSDIGVVFEDALKSGFYQDTQVFRGFEQKTVGEILESYSNTVEGGFEYRIDCDYDYDTASFTRVFRLSPVSLAEPPPPGDVYPVTSFGAEKLVFEYPGNIVTFSVEESAEDGATRFFVVGRIEDLGDAASQPYAGAAARDMLDSKTGRSWPVLDLVETLDEIQDELSLYEYATDYLYESRPPVSSFTVTVNGALDPVVGSYLPGQWCSLIVDDEFVRQRLASDQEPRDDVLVRRIESYSVSVSDNPVLPETVDLTLVTEWEVDRRGN
jgi:hypothetical protein